MAVAIVNLIVVWALLRAVPGQVVQLPRLSHVYELSVVGVCEGHNILEERMDLLGSVGKAGTGGLVAQSLRLNAINGGKGSPFYTVDLPQVQILAVKQTCTSKYIQPNRGNQTFAALIDYTCRGVACHQNENQIRTLRYVHLFSFFCLPAPDFRPGLYSQLVIGGVQQLPVIVDRDPPNTLDNPIVSPFGSCSQCRVQPPSLRDENYNPATACNG